MNDCNKFGCKKLVTRCEDCGRTANEIVMPTKEWVSLNERFPEEDKRVLIFSDGGISIGQWDKTNGYWSSEKWSDCEFLTTFHRITHWMPLPEPPNE